jgi:hypothetical protein
VLGLIVATPVLPLDHAPPPTVLLKVVLPPTQIAWLPLSVPALGAAVTVTLTFWVALVPQPFDAVTVYVPVAAVVAFDIKGFCVFGALNPFGPVQLYVIVPEPVAEAFKLSVEPAQMGLLLPAVVIEGPLTGVPAQPQLGAVPVYTSLIVQELLSLQGVPGNALPPITPRQSALQAPS